MTWIEDAMEKNELKVTNNNNCPICNPEHRTDVDTKVNACEQHKWTSRSWLQGQYPELFARWESKQG